MKLSADAKRHIAAQIAAAFADDLRKLREKAKAEKDEHDKKIEGIADVLDNFKANVVKPALAKLLAKHGLTFSKGRDIDKVDIEFCSTSDEPYTYNHRFNPEYLDKIFVELRDSTETCKEINRLESEIKDRVSFALYEIEIHGKKNTLESIIKQAIDIEVEKLVKQED